MIILSCLEQDYYYSLLNTKEHGGITFNYVNTTEESNTIFLLSIQIDKYETGQIAYSFTGNGPIAFIHSHYLLCQLLVFNHIICNF